jgi:Regulator of ribonuclease activity B
MVFSRSNTVRLGRRSAASRHVIYYSYAPGKEVAQAMEGEAAEAGWKAEVREPLPDFPDHWGVVCERHAVTSPDFVREADDFFQELAGRHGAEYDGWEASA